MWRYIAGFILRNRVFILIFILLVTIFMGYKAKDVELDYQYPELLPKTDSIYKEYKNFKEKFTDAGISVLIGIQDKKFLTKDKVNDWIALQDSIKNIDDIKSSLSFIDAIYLKKNSKEKKFEIKKIFHRKITSQHELDSLNVLLHSFPFYKDFVYYDSSRVFVMAIEFEPNIINKKDRETVVANIERLANKYGEKHNLKIRYSGLAYYRTVKAQIVKSELYLFIFFAMLVTTVILFLFFRSFKIIGIALLIVAIAAVWAFGSMVLFNYKITVLTGMIPTLLIVIGIPNSVFLLNKFHKEFRTHGNKIKALHRVIARVGNASFLTNLTTAAGFATFIITQNSMLVEFGIIASLNIMALFLLSVSIIPIAFSFFKNPKEKHVKHLDYKRINKLIDFLIQLVNNKRKAIYITVIVLSIVAVYGISKIYTKGYLVDDIPQDHPIFLDLKFFENTMGGTMPVEATVTLKKENDSINYFTFEKIEKFQNEIKKYPILSRSFSVTDAMKFANQAFYRGKEKFYRFPDVNEASRLQSYIAGFSKADDNGLANAYIDSTKHTVRISLRAKDIGTDKMDTLFTNLKSDLSKIFPSDIYSTVVTGASVVFTKGIAYLLYNLFMSLALAFVVISLVMATMFTSFKMIVISLIPNILPLAFTAAVMGYFGVTIKPTTILVFSISFGISVDNAIHFLTKYRIELAMNNCDVYKSVVNSMKEAGVSIVYTATILFFGFLVLTASNFWGTVALGMLVSLTLFFAMMSNLILLPAILLSFKPDISKRK